LASQHHRHCRFGIRTGYREAVRKTWRKSMNREPPRLPLSGITVVSLEQAIAAPLASRHLADWGARVIKIERPGKGDFCRDYDYVMNGMSSQFAWTNRSKESLALDVKSDEGKRVLDALLPRADVFLQNLAPGAASRLGLDAATLVERFPRLIACDISGYGRGGPYSRKKAYDLLVQCEAGFLSVNGTEGHPAKCGIAVVDTATGMYILNGVLMALFNRERTGKGMAFEVSLFDSMTEWMSYPAYYTDGAGKPLVRTGTRHATIAPYGPFKCGDGRVVFFGIQNEREWTALCGEVLEDAALARDPRFCGNPQRMQHREALEALIERSFAKFSAEQVMQRLDDAAIANANMNTVEAFLEHPQLHARDRVRKVGSPNGPLMSFLPAITIPGVTPVMGDIPSIGEHTDAILAELGLLETTRT
jgi:itaconate CoA-transferase